MPKDDVEAICLCSATRHKLPILVCEAKGRANRRRRKICRLAGFVSGIRHCRFNPRRGRPVATLLFVPPERRQFDVSEIEGSRSEDSSPLGIARTDQQRCRVVDSIGAQAGDRRKVAPRHRLIYGVSCPRTGRGPVLGWRLPMEQTDIESHGIESSRRITATSFRVIGVCRTIEPPGWCMPRWLPVESRPSCAWGRQGRRDERFPVCGMGGAGRGRPPGLLFDCEPR